MSTIFHPSHKIGFCKWLYSLSPTRFEKRSGFNPVKYKSIDELYNEFLVYNFCEERKKNLIKVLIEFNKKHGTNYIINHNGLENGIYIGNPQQNEQEKEELFDLVKQNGYSMCNYYGGAESLWIVLKTEDGTHWENGKLLLNIDIDDLDSNPHI